VTPEQCRTLQGEFVGGFEAKLSGRSELPVPGSGEVVSLPDLQRSRRYTDQAAAVRRAAGPDRSLLDRLPLNPTVLHDFFRRRLFGRDKVVTVAAVCVADLEPLAGGREPGPAGSAAMQEALAGLPPGPLLVGLFSPTGWTDDAAAGIPDDPRRRVALVSRRLDDGTWDVRERDGRVSVLSDLFDPETEGRKQSRTVAAVRAAVEALPAGEVLYAADLTRRLRVPARLVVGALEDFAGRFDDLRMVEASGRLVMYRTPIAASAPTLLKRLWPFSRTEETRLELLAEQRVRLQVLRRRLWQELEGMHAEEARMLEAGRGAGSEAERKRLASQIAGVRREARHRARMGEMADRQVEILSGHLHNLELVALGRMAATPDAEEIRTAADKAQELITDLSADAKLAEETSPDASALSAEEDAILREFEKGRDAELASLVIRPETPKTSTEEPAAEPPRRRLEGMTE
jgi:hypothetical protein